MPMNSKTLARADLYSAVCDNVGLSRRESAELVEAVLEEVSATLEEGESVKISSFGSFHVRSKNARMGRNPKTGEAAPIHARRVLTFKASHILKNRINTSLGGG